MARGGATLVPVLAVGGITVSLQQTSVIPLVPQFPALLDTSATNATWVVTSTLLAAAVATPVVGRMADMFGKRRMLLVCLAVLVVGSTVAALSDSLAPMVVGRSLQGLAVGVIPLGISLMRDQLPPERLGSATALMSASLGVGGALGLPLSALVAQAADWHLLFAGAGALGALVFVLVIALVPESPQRTGGRFDAVGALLLSTALTCLLLAVSKGGTWGWSSPTTLGLFGVSAVALLAFGPWELRAREPLVDLRVSARRQVLLTNAASAVFGFSMFAMSLVFPQLLQAPTATGYGLGESILVAGLIMAPGGLCMMAMSPVSARISAASGPRTTLMVGTAVVAAGYVIGVLFHGAVWQLMVASLVISSGVGLGYGAMPSLIMAAVPVTQTAAANSLNNLMRAIGTSSASAVAGVLLAGLTTTVGGAAVPTEFAFELVLGLGAAASVLAFVITAFNPRRAAQGSSGPDRAAERSPARDAVGAAAVACTPGAPAAWVSGVVRADGLPAAGAAVTVIGARGRQLGTARADSAGAYRIPIGAGHAVDATGAAAPATPAAAVPAADAAGSAGTASIAAPATDAARSGGPSTAGGSSTSGGTSASGEPSAMGASTAGVAASGASSTVGEATTAGVVMPAGAADRTGRTDPAGGAGDGRPHLVVARWNGRLRAAFLDPVSPRVCDVDVGDAVG